MRAGLVAQIAPLPHANPDSALIKARIMSAIYRVDTVAERFSASADWLFSARSKALVTLRAFDVLRINVRSLCWRNAMTAMRAIGIEGCANLL